MKINNITVKEYIVSKNKISYDNMLTALMPINFFMGKSFNIDEMSYIEIRQIEAFMKKGKDFKSLQELFSVFFRTSEEDFYNSKVIEFFSARNFIKEEVARLMDVEASLLKSLDIDSSLWESAGGDKLKPLSHLMPLMHLGKMYSVYPFDLEKKPYKEILYLLYGNKTLEEVTTQYNKLKNPKK